MGLQKSRHHQIIRAENQYMMHNTLSIKDIVLVW